MRLCERCRVYSSDDLRCSNCGYSFAARRAGDSPATTPIPGRPLDNPRKRKYTTLIPGFGVFGLLRRDSLTGQWGCAPGCLITAILAAILALGGYLFLHPYLAVSNIVPGGSMQVNGTNFPPDSTVDITVDGSLVAVHSTNVFASISGIMLRGRQTSPADHIVAVKSNGTFETTVPVPSSWTPGSHHTIQATTQNAQVSTQASIDVETQSPRQTSVVASDATPTDVPTVSPTATPTDVPTVSSTATPTDVPTVSSTATPTDVPTVSPTAKPAPVIHPLTSLQTQSQTVDATGPGTLGTQATGILEFDDPYSDGPAMTYAAGTIFQNNSGMTSNIQIMIDATAAVPPGPNGTVTVPAHVVQIGTIGNIPTNIPTSSNGPGFFNDTVSMNIYGNGVHGPVDIYNSVPFTGGTDAQSYTTVQQSDIDSAASSLGPSTKQSAIADIKSQLQSNEHLVGEPQCSNNVTSDHQAGDQATTVNVTVETTCTASAST